MIHGTVNELLDPVIRLRLISSDEHPIEIAMVVDTGFSGAMSLRPETIAKLKLPWLDSNQAILADGSVITFNTYEGRVVWNGEFRTVKIDAADADELVGMELLSGHRLTVDIQAGGPVTILPLQ